MASQAEHADRDTLAQHWSGDHAAIAAEPLQFAHLVFWIGLHITDLDSCALEQSSTDQGFTSRLEEYRVDFLFELRRKPVVRLGSKKARLVWKSDLCSFRFAKSDGRLHQRVKDCLQIERRPADHLEHVGGGGLLVQRLPEPLLRLRELACSLVELLPQVVSRGSNWLLAAFWLRPLRAARCHSCAIRQC